MSMEVLTPQIFLSYCSLDDLVTCRRVCKDWCRAANIVVDRLAPCPSPGDDLVLLIQKFPNTTHLDLAQIWTNDFGRDRTQIRELRNRVTSGSLSLELQHILRAVLDLEEGPVVHEEGGGVASTTLRTVVMPRWLSAPDMERLVQVSSVRRLSWRMSGGTFSSCNPLPNLTSLTVFTINEAHLCDLLRCLSAITHLKALDLCDLSIADREGWEAQDWSSLTQLKLLDKFRLNTAYFNGSLFLTLLSLSSLSCLYLSAMVSEINREGLEALGQMVQLTALDLKIGTLPVPLWGVSSALANLQALEYLRLGPPDVEEEEEPASEFLEVLAGLKNLKGLVLDHGWWFYMTELGTRLSGLTNLRYMDMGLEEEPIAVASQLPQLRILKLCVLHADIAAHHIDQLTALRALTLCLLKDIPDEQGNTSGSDRVVPGFTALSALSSLEVLQLEGFVYEGAMDLVVNTLASLRRLKGLDLGTEVDGQSAAMLGRLECLPSLSRLKLGVHWRPPTWPDSGWTWFKWALGGPSRKTQVDDVIQFQAVLSAFCQLRHLTHLSLTGVVQYTPATAQALGRLTELTRLRKFTSDRAAEILEVAPDLKLRVTARGFPLDPHIKKEYEGDVVHNMMKPLFNVQGIHSLESMYGGGD